MQGGTSQINRQRLQQVRDSGPRSLIIIDDLDFKSGHTFSDHDPVHFFNKGKEHQMTLGEAHKYARRFGFGTLFILPAKRPYENTTQPH